MRIVVNKKYKLIQVMGNLYRYISFTVQYNIHRNLTVSMNNSKSYYHASLKHLYHFNSLVCYKCKDVPYIA